KLLDRSRPVGAGGEDIFDPLLAERRCERAVRLAARALDRVVEVLCDAIFVPILLVPVLVGHRRLSERGLHRSAHARLITMLDHGLGPGREDLLPVECGLQRPARRQTLPRAPAAAGLLDLSEPEADELVPFLARQPAQRLAGFAPMRR